MRATRRLGQDAEGAVAVLRCQVVGAGEVGLATLRGHSFNADPAATIALRRVGSQSRGARIADADPVIWKVLDRIRFQDQMG